MGARGIGEWGLLGTVRQNETHSGLAAAIDQVHYGSRHQYAVRRDACKGAFKGPTGPWVKGANWLELVTVVTVTEEA